MIHDLKSVLPCFEVTGDSAPDYELIVQDASSYETWISQQSTFTQNWLQARAFKAEQGSVAYLPDEHGCLTQILLGTGEPFSDFNQLTAAVAGLPTGRYQCISSLRAEQMAQLVLAWGLVHYQFCAYKTKPALPKLLLSTEPHILDQLWAIYLVRDLINIPMEDLGPDELLTHTQSVAAIFQAQVTSIAGEDLLDANYPAVHMVGRASARAPRLIELNWGHPDHPRLTLVGKGVCFDSGGLNLKTGNNMLLMKKDMGGAAHALALAYWVMANQLPVRLRVLLPAVENAVSANAYRPGDVMRMRNGMTVEITNTDAEGRLILADALTAACEQPPDLLLDFATLTGAARIAVGTEIAALFSKDATLSHALQSLGNELHDPIWALPLYEGYRDKLHSDIADLVNSAADGYAGATTAALFLQHFVDSEVTWAHFDLMAWNVDNKPGRPRGGEAMSLRALFAYLEIRYPKTNPQEKTL